MEPFVCTFFIRTAEDSETRCTAILATVPRIGEFVSVRDAPLQSVGDWYRVVDVQHGVLKTGGTYRQHELHVLLEPTQDA